MNFIEQNSMLLALSDALIGAVRDHWTYVRLELRGRRPRVLFLFSTATESDRSECDEVIASFAENACLSLDEIEVSIIVTDDPVAHLASYETAPWDRNAFGRRCGE